MAYRTWASRLRQASHLPSLATSDAKVVGGQQNEQRRFWWRKMWKVNALGYRVIQAAKATFSFSRLPGLRGIRRAVVANKRRECDARAFLTCLTTQELQKGSAILSVNGLVGLRKSEWLAWAYLPTDCLSVFH